MAEIHSERTAQRLAAARRALRPQTTEEEEPKPVQRLVKRLKKKLGPEPEPEVEVTLDDGQAVLSLD